MFRRVLTTLPGQLSPGQLFLHSMPGRRESIEEFQHEASVQAVSLVVCLNDETEIARKSPAYAAAIADGTFTCPRDVFPIPNLGVPADRKAFVALARETAARIRTGGRVLVHCALGIGRTGTFACCVLMELGHAEQDARAAIRAAGGYPETTEQDDLIKFVARRIGSTISSEVR
jgi:protein-tyrosine phosphatase